MILTAKNAFKCAGFFWDVVGFAEPKRSATHLVEVAERAGRRLGDDFETAGRGAPPNKQPASSFIDQATPTEPKRAATHLNEVAERAGRRLGR